MHGSRKTLSDPDVRQNEYSTSWAFPFDEAISKTLKRGRLFLLQAPLIIFYNSHFLTLLRSTIYYINASDFYFFFGLENSRH